MNVHHRQHEDVGAGGSRSNRKLANKPMAPHSSDTADTVLL